MEKQLTFHYFTPEIYYFPSLVGVVVPCFLPADPGCILYVPLGTGNLFV